MYSNVSYDVIFNTCVCKNVLRAENAMNGRFMALDYFIRVGECPLGCGRSSYYLVIDFGMKIYMLRVQEFLAKKRPGDAGMK